MRDFQRARVYGWQDECLETLRTNSRLSASQCERLAYRICDNYSTPIPYITYRESKKALAYPEKINLPEWARHKVVVLHEITHVICFAEHEYIVSDEGEIEPYHGSGFVTLFISILLNEKIASLKYLTNTADAFGVLYDKEQICQV